MIFDLPMQIDQRHVTFRLDLDPKDFNDGAIITYFNANRPPEPEVVHVMGKVLRPGDFAVDCGANIGFFTLLMVELMAPGGFVLACEPGSNNLPKLRANVELNKKHSSVQYCDQPLWDSLTTKPFYIYPDGGGNSLAPHEPSDVGSMEKTTTLAREVQEKPRLIKMDIEGAEFHACRGMLTGPASHADFIIMEMNTEAMAKFDVIIDDIRQWMASRGRDMFLLHESGILPTLLPRHSRLKPSRLNCNVMFTTLDLLAESYPEVLY